MLGLPLGRPTSTTKGSEMNDQQYEYLINMLERLLAVLAEVRDKLP